ncbi:ammonium transporter [Stylonychia lemnae]|uniref:Ammonium transporter n=1 Tax=Stylonychia lemnae TaxID=5949 RepID=A0A078AF67_STYLE|nr:ammonium transporter [Stylonychia lemnae]|eukprot:CDW80476.1 ammonium transporter [Stylonychia lemnae]
MEGNYTQSVYTQKQGTDAIWILVSAGFIFFMTAGFTLIESGAVRYKNRSSVLIKNLFNVCICAIAFWLVGYGFAFGNPEYFIGNDQKFYSSYGFEQQEQDHYLLWVIQFAYCMIVVTVYQGALAERTQIAGYVIMTFLLAGFVYPVILAWTWGQGWLFDKGFHDFAGTGIVHLVGGTTGFWGAVVVGERQAKQRLRVQGAKEQPLLDDKTKRLIGRRNADFNQIAQKHSKRNSHALIANNNTFIVLGTLIVITGYMFFTGGRTYSQFVPRTGAPAKIIQNTLISCAFSGLVSFGLKPLVLGNYNRATKYDCLTLCNGILIGLVSIAGVADRVQNWGAVLIGSIAAVFYVGGCIYLEFWRIDDPLEVFQVHGLGGVWGLFATGFFDNIHGALYKGALKQGHFMGYQIVGIVVIVAWTSLITLIGFYVLRKLHLLRVDKAIEEIGFDVAELGGVSDEFLNAVRQQINSKRSDKVETQTDDEQEDDEEYIKKQLQAKQDDIVSKYLNSAPLKELKGEAYLF